MKTKNLNAVKIFIILSVLGGFILLIVAGTPLTVTGDLVSAQTNDEKSLTNFFGAMGTVFVAFGIFALAYIFMYGMCEIMSKARKEMLETKNKKVKVELIKTILGSMSIYVLASLVAIFSAFVVLYGIFLLKDAYNCQIYGVDTIVSSVERAYDHLTLLTFIFYCAIFLIRFFVQNKKGKKYNDLSFEEKCQLTAKEIKAGKRDWYLNPIIGTDNYLVAPLSSENMDELGGGIHVSVDLKHIEKHVAKGQIQNLSTFETIMKYL